MPVEKYYSHSAPQPFTLWWDVDSTPYPEAPGFSPPEALDLTMVDAPLRPLVQAINASPHMGTVSACAGHPGRDAYGVVHVELWLRVVNIVGLGLLHDWIERAVRHRKLLGGYSKERVIRLEYLARGHYGWYFVVYADFISIPENARVIEALTATWQP